MTQVASRSFAVQAALDSGKQILGEQFLVDCLQQNKICGVAGYVLPLGVAASSKPAQNGDVMGLQPVENGAECHTDTELSGRSEVPPAVDADAYRETENQSRDMEVDGPPDHMDGEEADEENGELEVEGCGRGEAEQEHDNETERETETDKDKEKEREKEVREEFVSNLFDEDVPESPPKILPEVKMWKYREFGAPYFPTTYGTPVASLL